MPEPLSVVPPRVGVASAARVSHAAVAITKVSTRYAAWPRLARRLFAAKTKAECMDGIRIELRLRYPAAGAFQCCDSVRMQ